MLKTSPLRRRSASTATKQTRRGQQRGMMILESLVSIMIVMLGIVGIASLLAKSTALSGQAQYRTEAGMFAEQIIQMISLSVDRSTPDTLATSLKTFEHQGSGDEFRQPLAWDARGSAVSQWKIPAAAKRGTYNVILAGGKGNREFTGDFRVSDFRLPVFAGSERWQVWQRN